MKRFILWIACALAFQYVSAQGVRFSNQLSWEQVKQKAKAERKYIFLDFYTTWCGPCKHMDGWVYPEKLAGDFFNAKFISLKLQLDRTAADKPETKAWYDDAKKLAAEMKVQAYPTLIFLSPEGKLVRKVTGGKSVEELVWNGKKAMDSTIADFQPPVPPAYASLEERYGKGERSGELMREYARQTRAKDEAKAKKLADEYINSLPEAALYDRDNIWFVYEFTKKTSDRGYPMFRDNAAQIEAKDPRMQRDYAKRLVYQVLHTEEVRPWVKSNNGRPDWNRIEENLRKYGKLGKEIFETSRENIIYKMIYDPAIKPFEEPGKADPDWVAIDKELQEFGALGTKLSQRMKYYFYYNKHVNTEKRDGFDQFLAATKNYLEKYIDAEAPVNLNCDAWQVFLYADDAATLKLALQWTTAALKKEPGDAHTIDTHANLYYKLGNKKEALKWQEKALQLDPDNEAMRAALNKMKAGKPTWTKE